VRTCYGVQTMNRVLQATSFSPNTSPTHRMLRGCCFIYRRVQSTAAAQEWRLYIIQGAFLIHDPTAWCMAVRFLVISSDSISSCFHNFARSS
jgi:hypothetical protein